MRSMFNKEVKLPETAEVWKCKPVFIDRTYEIR